MNTLSETLIACELLICRHAPALMSSSSAAVFGRRKGQWLTEEDKLTVVELYRTQSAQKIAALMGVSSACIFKLLKRRGIPRRPPGRQRKSSLPIFPSEHEQRGPMAKLSIKSRSQP